MRAAVTGGAGFIGSNLVDALVSRGAAVLVVDDLSRGTADNLAAAQSGVELARIDIRDGDAVARALCAFRPELVFHLAAQVDVRVSMTDPAFDAGVNVLGSINVFAAADQAGVRRVVNTSTGGAVYGATGQIPTPETAATDPISAYGLSKRTVESYAAWFRAARGLDVVTLRYGNVYGPRQDPRGDAGVIAIFCDRVLRGVSPTIYGDGSQTRDFVFVADIVEANLGAADATTLRHREYNVGTGTEVSVLELVAAVAAAAGGDSGWLAAEFRPARAGELLRSCLDVRRAHAELQLPAPTPIAEGLGLTLDWMRSVRSRLL